MLNVIRRHPVPSALVVTAVLVILMVVLFVTPTYLHALFRF